MSLQRVIDTAAKEVGFKETVENLCKYNTEYYGKEVSGKAYPYCVVFLWWVFRHSGEESAFFNGGKTASCSMLRRLYEEEGKWFKDSIEVGDIALLNFDGKGTTDHCGLVIEVGRNYFKTIEGNTSVSGSQEAGDGVCVKMRYKKNLVGCCRPAYRTDIPTDYDKHWAKEYIETVKDAGLMVGYNDGSFKPNEPLTRGEAAKIIAKLLERMK